MNKLKLNFSSFERRQRQQRQGFMLVILALLLGLLCNEYFKTAQQIELQQNPQAYNSNRDRTPILSREVQRELESLRNVINELNIPWASLLTAMETVKQANPDVLLTRFEPNQKKSELLLSGQVTHLDDLLTFIDSLNQQAAFSQVLLQSQQLVDDEDTMLFKLKLRWLSHE